jgi:hypothetical protein
MEIRKIAIASFLSGALFYLLAVILAPEYTWVAFLGGLIVGYVGYDLREFLRAIPEGLRAARKKIWQDKLVAPIAEWFAERHPFIYPAGVLVVVPFIYLYRAGLEDILTSPQMVNSLQISFFGGVMYAITWFLFVACSFVVGGLLYGVALLGAKATKVYFMVPMDTHEEDLESDGLRKIDLTYGSAFKLMAAGMWVILLILMFDLWRLIFQFWWIVISTVLTRVHSSKRVICAIDGTAAGVLGYHYLAPGVETSSTHLTYALICGIIGAILGNVHWKIASSFFPQQNSVPA